MGDNHAVEISGIGTIKLKMYDGLIRTISGVRHVKDLKKNLLSVGQFDSLGCKIRTDNGIMKIVKGALVVLKARKTVANMFVLMGETHHGAEASIASASPAEEKTMMWHQKLGHMSEKGLKVLSDKKLLPGLTKETTEVQMENTQNHTSSEAVPEHEEQEQIESETPEVRRSTHGVFESHASTGRNLLQTKKACPVNFEFLNYTIITSQCKGPQYPPSSCCASFKEFACPYANLINDLTNECASIMFSYINLNGKYPPGLFSNECKDGKLGLECPAPPPSEPASDKNGSQIMHGPPLLLILLAVFIVTTTLHIFVLEACFHLKAHFEGKQVHCQIIKAGIVPDTHIHSSLIHMYTNSGSIDDAEGVLGEFSEENTLPKNAMISGYLSDLWPS
ncbi:hypothetical protein POTOM_040299 [Populus tomentosa]|uniref:GAG-pre-integrase domain-containing protein n=1 Tax=Populus tomentosa TaxID=118781 RepID=A0A8X7YU67_POPTO|nr:hypothetical protein POTOM_040299 [Populus tomentosa]